MRSRDATKSRPPSVAVAAEVDAEVPDLGDRAAALGEALQLPLLSLPDAESASLGFLLVATPRRLELRDMVDRAAGPVYVDFIRGATAFRGAGASRRQPIGRAVGLDRGFRSVVDATAGLARDAFLLACLGCEVLAIERSPVLAALVQDGLTRGIADGGAPLGEVLNRITLVVDDARQVLGSMAESQRPDVVYLDPMYPTGRRRLPKKEMQVCRRLVGSDEDSGSLLEVARAVARRRVVVKRHPTAAALVPAVAMSYEGKRACFDVYHPIERSLGD